MPESISPETTESIRALCRQISVAHDLDDEIQRELFTHMEDKLLGYLSGEEKVTEKDAFILMREHFGDPVVIRELLRETHAIEVRVGFWRKTVLFSWAVWGAFVFQYCLQVILISGFMLLTHMLYISDSSRMAMKLSIAGTKIVAFFVLWYILLIWRRGIERGHQPWIFRHKLNIKEIISYWILGTIAANIIFTLVNVLIEYSQNSMLLYILNPNQTTKDLEVILQYMGAVTGIIFNVTFIWWMDWPSRGVQSLIKGIGYIVVLNVLFLSAGFLMSLNITEPGKIEEMLARNVRNNSIPLFVAIGIYLIYYPYRRILDRKLRQIA